MTATAPQMTVSKPFLTSTDILEFIKARPKQHISRNDLIKTFEVPEDDVPALRKLLKEMRKNELIIKTSGNYYRLPHQDDFIEIEAIIKEKLQEAHQYHATIICAYREKFGEHMTIYASKRAKSPKVGDKVRVRVKKSSKKGRYGKIISPSKKDIIFKGMVRKLPDDGFEVVPINKKQRWTYQIHIQPDLKISQGDFVSFKIQKFPDQSGKRVYFAVIQQVLKSDIDHIHSISTIALEDGHIPHCFSSAHFKETNLIQEITFENSAAKRDDLTHLPFVTIDPHDARDHDDAIFVELNSQTGGASLYVAIADVSAYVRAGTIIDHEAQERGNSVYLPDRVVPMLPEHLSNNLCSLKADMLRPVLVAKINIDAEGQKTNHQFMRAFIRCRANMSYEEFYEAANNPTHKAFHQFQDPVIKPVTQAYKLLKIAHHKRMPLDLDLPEYKIILDQHNAPIDVSKKERLFTHRLIEEFMVLANVCAAETLEKYNFPVIYRSHDEPPQDKVATLNEALKTQGIRLKSRSATLNTKVFNELLRNAKGTNTEETISKMVLRTQCQAVYNIDNQGHFGLNLTHYTHFTSPIRRYADLMIHRYLIRALKLGDDGITDAEIDGIKDLCQHICTTERRAITAEIETKDRFLAELLKSRTSDQFKARISGITNSGIFVRLPEYGAEGFVPIHYLGQFSKKKRYFQSNDARNMLTDKYSGQYYMIGQPIHVTLLEANPLTGGMIFTLVDEEDLNPATKFSEIKKDKFKKKKRIRRG